MENIQKILKNFQIAIKAGKLAHCLKILHCLAIIAALAAAVLGICKTLMTLKENVK